MIKNVVFKKILKNSVFKIASQINKLIPKDDNLVLLYSANKGIQFSLIPLRDYLIKNGFDKRYRIICGVENLKFADNCGLEFASRLKSYLLFFRARHVFYTTGQIPIKPAKLQVVIHLRHGNANYKSCGLKTNINNGDDFFFTYMVASSPFFKKIMCEEFNCEEKNIVIAGDPLIDELLGSVGNLKSSEQQQKLILWLPTFRKSDYLGYDDSSMEDLVPMYKESDYKELNNILKQYNTKLIVKLHPAQKCRGWNTRHFSNLAIYSDEEFKMENLNMYTLLAQSDALIGDYSSVSIQYLVLNKPLAFVIPDFEEYEKFRGFAFSNVKNYMPGYHISSKDELNDFIKDIHDNKDNFVNERKKIRNIFYSYVDTNNCERIVRLSDMK